MVTYSKLAAAWSNTTGRVVRWRWRYDRNAVDNNIYFSIALYIFVVVGYFLYCDCSYFALLLCRKFPFWASHNQSHFTCCYFSFVIYESFHFYYFPFRYYFALVSSCYSLLCWNSVIRCAVFFFLLHYENWRICQGSVCRGNNVPNEFIDTSMNSRIATIAMPKTANQFSILSVCNNSGIYMCSSTSYTLYNV